MLWDYDLIRGAMTVDEGCLCLSVISTILVIKLSVCCNYLQTVPASLYFRRQFMILIQNTRHPIRQLANLHITKSSKMD